MKNKKKDDRNRLDGEQSTWISKKVNGVLSLVVIIFLVVIAITRYKYDFFDDVILSIIMLSIGVVAYIITFIIIFLINNNNKKKNISNIISSAAINSNQDVDIHVVRSFNYKTEGKDETKGKIDLLTAIFPIIIISLFIYIVLNILK